VVPRRHGRPRATDPAETKQRILDAAQEIVLEYGERGLTIRDVARAAGVSVSVVHHHFESREGLLDACIEIAYSEFRVIASTLAGSIGQEPPAQLIERAVREGFRFARGRRAHLRILHALVSEHGGLDLARDRTLQLPMLEMMERWLGPSLGVPPSELRLRVKSIVMLTTRYACSRDVELLRCAGTSEIERAERAVEDHLVALARMTLMPPAARSDDAPDLDTARTSRRAARR
jgi:AcrR family transcriptional regulator